MYLNGTMDYCVTVFRGRGGDQGPSVGWRERKGIFNSGLKGGVLLANS